MAPARRRFEMSSALLTIFFALAAFVRPTESTTVCLGYPEAPGINSSSLVEQISVINEAALNDDEDFIGTEVTIEGIVVADLRAFGENKYFVQAPSSHEPPATEFSQGITIFCGTPTSSCRSPGSNFEEGDFVRVKGTLNNFNQVPQLLDASAELLNSTKFQPEADNCPPLAYEVNVVSVTLPLESVSQLVNSVGMLIMVENEEVTITNTFGLRFGQISISGNGKLVQPAMIFEPGTEDFNALREENLRNVLVLDDVAASICPVPQLYFDPEGLGVRTGWKIPGQLLDSTYVLTVFEENEYHLKPNIVGREIVPNSYDDSSNPRFNNPIDQLIRGNRINRELQEEEPQFEQKDFRIGGLNMLNYFRTLRDENCPDCRGADTPSEFSLQQKKLFKTILGLDAAVLGLEEIENGGNDLLEFLVDNLNREAGSNKYDIIKTGVVGRDTITTAIIYQPDRVTPIGKPRILQYEDPVDKSRPSIAQTFSPCGNGGDFDTRFTFVTVHLKSKGSGCDEDDEDSPAFEDHVDGEGSCGFARLKHVQQLLEWVASDPTSSKSDKFVIAGDFNAYTKERAIKEVVAAGFINLGERDVGSKDLYSFSFDGEFGTLDYIFSSESMSGFCKDTLEWHTNSDEPFLADYNEDNCNEKPENFHDTSVFRASDHDSTLSFCSFTCEIPEDDPSEFPTEVAAIAFFGTMLGLIFFSLCIECGKKIPVVNTFLTRLSVLDPRGSMRRLSAATASMRRMSFQTNRRGSAERMNDDLTIRPATIFPGEKPKSSISESKLSVRTGNPMYPENGRKSDV